MTKQIYHTTNWPQIVFSGAFQHTTECRRVKIGSVFPPVINSPLGPSARAQDIRVWVHGLKQNRWPLAWVEQSHLSNLSILYGEWSEPCTGVSFCVLLSRDLMAPPPQPHPPLPHTHTHTHKWRACSQAVFVEWKTMITRMNSVISYTRNRPYREAQL